MPGLRDLLCPLQPPSLFFSSPLSSSSVLVLFVRPVSVCHDDNKQMLTEAVAAMGPLGTLLAPLPVQAHRVSGSGAEHPWIHVMERGDGMGTYLSPPLPPPLSPSCFLMKYREIIYI